MFGAFFALQSFRYCVYLYVRKEDLHMKTDIEIAQSTEMLPVGQVAEKAGIDENLLDTSVI